jgi:hypothetical protein
MDWGEKGLTSAYDPAEFFEQTLGDRDLQNLIPQFADELRTRGAYEAVLGFHHALAELERLVATTSRKNIALLLGSDAWTRMQTVARHVLAVPPAQARLSHIQRF